MSIVIAIIAFCVIILIHEFGHFFVAKAFGMKVTEFAIGMGPTLLRKRGKETVYCLKLIPMGGSCSLGEDEDSDDPRSFRNKPVWQRMLVIVAGAAMNLILGFVVCIFAVIAGGDITTTIIAEFKDNAVSSSQLMVNDEIVSINGMSIWTSMDISYCFQNQLAALSDDAKSVSYNFVVKRDGKLVELDNVTFALNQSPDATNGMIVDFYVYPQKLNFFNTIETAFKTSLTEGRLIWITLIDFLKGTYGINDLSGPIGVVDSIGKVAAISLNSLFLMIAFISINVGIFNLLPIPALDGARFVFLLIEAIRRKPIKPEHEGMVHFVGLCALFLLFIIVTFNDIMRIFTGG